MTSKDPAAPAEPSGKPAADVIPDKRRADARRMLEALEDDEVREALKSPQVDRTDRRK